MNIFKLSHKKLLGLGGLGIRMISVPKKLLELGFSGLEYI